MEIVSEKTITEDQAVAEVLNKFFINIAPNLKISIIIIIIITVIIIIINLFHVDKTQKFYN